MPTLERSLHFWWVSKLFSIFRGQFRSLCQTEKNKCAFLDLEMPVVYNTRKFFLQLIL